MLKYIVGQLVYTAPTLLIISILVFVIIELPPGDYLTSYVTRLQEVGARTTEEEVLALEKQYGLDQPIYVRYVKWLWRMLHGDFGISLTHNKPVSELIWDRVGLTFAVSFSALLINWAIAFPVGIYSAVRQYSIGDYLFTSLAFISAATPQFMIALVIMWILFSRYSFTMGGLFSMGMESQPWSWLKFVDLMKHVGVAFLILGISGGVSLIRTMRANLLDELHRPYVTTARAKGLQERRLLLKYPVRVALNPFVSTVGWVLPGLISGTTIVSIVLGLPTTGPLLFSALQNQDMYLAGSFLMMLSLLTVIGTLLSDILLAWLDPRIRISE
jgi:peptide/nickel transport system permease protein